jgi:putative hydrolase of the HAD superfamily
VSSPLRGVSAVFFDLDDTLCAYWVAAKAGLRSAFEHAAIPGKSPDEMAEHWAEAFRAFYPALKPEGWYEAYLKSGEPTRTELMRRTLLLAGIDDPELARRIGDRYAEERLRALALFPDAGPIVEWLGERYRLGLITNGPADVQNDEIDALGIRGRFDVILIEGELGFGKPNSEIFRIAEREIGFSGREILFVGNSYAHDVMPALEAGWQAVWIRRPDDVPPSARGAATAPEDPPDGSPAPSAVLGSLAELAPLLT